MNCDGPPFGLSHPFFQRLDFRHMECLCLVLFLLPLFGTSAFSDASQGIRSLAIDECKNLAQSEQKDEQRVLCVLRVLVQDYGRPSKRPVTTFTSLAT